MGFGPLLRRVISLRPTWMGGGGGEDGLGVRDPQPTPVRKRIQEHSGMGLQLAFSVQEPTGVRTTARNSSRVGALTNRDGPEWPLLSQAVPFDSCGSQEIPASWGLCGSGGRGERLSIHGTPGE